MEAASLALRMRCIIDAPKHPATAGYSGQPGPDDQREGKGHAKQKRNMN